MVWPSVSVMNNPEAPKVSRGVNIKIEAPKIGSLLNKSSTCTSGLALHWLCCGSKFPPEVGKQTAEGKIKTLKTSGSTEDKLSRSSSKVGILPTKTVALGSAKV